MYNPYEQHNRLPEIETAVSGGVSLCLNGLYGSSQALLAGALCGRTGGIHIILIEEKEEASYFFSDLQSVCSPETVLFLPSSYRRASNQLRPDEGNMIMRNHVISRITQHKAGNRLLLVTYPEALQEKVLTAETMGRNTLTLNTGERISISFLRDMLLTYGSNRPILFTSRVSLPFEGGLSISFRMPLTSHTVSIFLARRSKVYGCLMLIRNCRNSESTRYS